MTSLAPGTVLPPFAMHDIDLAQITEFMDLMGDVNPVHTDEALTARLGLRGPVAQGPASLAYVINMLIAWRADGFLERLEFRFRDTVTVGDTVTAGGVVQTVEDIEGGELVQCGVSLELQTGAEVLSGAASMRLPAAAPAES